MVGMRRTRVAAIFLAGVAVAVAGCGSSSDGQQGAPEPAPNALASVDPCQILEPSELRAQGLNGPGEPLDQGIGEKICEYSGETFDLSVIKGEQSSKQYWETRRGNMGVYEPNTVGAREGLEMISKTAVGNGVCSQAIFAGQGSVSVQVTTAADKYENDDATCAKAMEIAQVVEPKLPK